MEPTGVILDEATVKQLTTANGHPIPLRNITGEVIGYYVSSAEMSRIEKHRRGTDPAIDKLYTPDEIARLEERRKNDPRPNVSHEEVIRWIEGQ